MEGQLAKVNVDSIDKFRMDRIHLESRRQRSRHVGPAEEVAQDPEGTCRDDKEDVSTSSIHGESVRQDTSGSNGGARFEGHSVSAETEDKRYHQDDERCLELDDDCH